MTADHTPERLSAEERVRRLTEWRNVREYGEEQTPFSNGARKMAMHVRAELPAILAAHLADVEARLAAAWDEGAERGFDSHAPEDLTDVQAGNPYRAALHPDPSEPT